MDKTLTTMNRQIDHVIRLIDDLLDVSRITGGKLELRRQTMELGVAVERAIEICAPLLASRNQTAHIESAGPVTATVDGTRIAQIVSNLINNAAKHSESGAKIIVKLSRVEGSAVIDVVDHGAGIPAEQLERVFDMFTKIDRPGQWSRDGLGIGLALSRRLASLHGGSLTASSPGESKGSTFTLTLPTDVAAPDSATQLPKTKTPAPANHPPLNIVLVEDNEDAAMMMELWLSHDKHTVQVARNGADGIALIKDAKPDVVLCDIGLPDMDGVDVCQRVLAETADPPVMVALTGWGTEADRRRTRHGGFYDHLVKPVDLGKLRELLGTLAARRSDQSSRVG
jgi:CheY-like chemotaxis protein